MLHVVQYKRKESFMLFSDHNKSLLRRRPGATNLVQCASLAGLGSAAVQHSTLHSI